MNKRLSLFALLMISPLLLLHAGGQLEISGAPPAVQTDYPSTGEEVTTVTFTLSNSSNFTFYEVGITAGTSGDPENRFLLGGGGEQIPYRITAVGGTGSLKDRPDNPAPEEILSGSLGRRESTTLSFEVRVPAGGTPSAGLYTDTVSLVAWDFNFGNWEISSQQNVSIVLTVGSQVELSLVPAGGGFDSGGKSYTLDFGFLESGEIGGLDLLIRGNVGYTLSVSSANRGQLRHIDPLDGSAISYQLRASGEPVNLTTGSAQIADSIAPPGSDGARYNLAFQVGQVGAASSGEYRDVVQVVVTAR